jgi:hypothetical protein
VSGEPCSPATDEKRRRTSLEAPGWKTAALGVHRDVFGDDELAERAAALGVRVALRHALAVERGELLDEEAVVEGGDAVGTRRE